MRKSILAFGVLGGIALMLGASGQASAITCSGIYHGLGTTGEGNGTTTLPGRDVGTVQAGCQIGDLATNNVSGTGVFVSPTSDPSIFQFEWDGGGLLIEVSLGNNGTLLGGVDVELGLAAGNTLVASGGLGSFLTSINFSAPFVFGVTKTLFDGNLDAGTYVIDTYSGTLIEDPTYQIDFTPTSAVPEPGTLLLVGTGLAGAGAWGRTRWFGRKSA